MRKTILTAIALVLHSSAVIAQSTDTKSPASTGPTAESGSMSKGDMSKDKISRKKMAKSKSSTKMKKRTTRCSLFRDHRDRLRAVFCLADYLSLGTHG
jgi:hypothetical protein